MRRILLLLIISSLSVHLIAQVIIPVDTNLNPFKDNTSLDETALFSTGNDSMPKLHLALSCYPNPIETTTTIIYTLPHAGEHNLTLHNKRGVLVKEILKTSLNEGQHEYTVDLSGEKKGLYFVVLHSSYGQQTLPVFIY